MIYICWGGGKSRRTRPNGFIAACVMLNLNLARGGVKKVLVSYTTAESRCRNITRWVVPIPRSRRIDRVLRLYCVWQLSRSRWKQHKKLIPLKKKRENKRFVCVTGDVVASCFVSILDYEYMVYIYIYSAYVYRYIYCHQIIGMRNRHPQCERMVV